jgi:hypothetical protein
MALNPEGQTNKQTKKQTNKQTNKQKSEQSRPNVILTHQTYDQRLNMSSGANDH